MNWINCGRLNGAILSWSMNVTQSWRCRRCKGSLGMWGHSPLCRVYEPRLSPRLVNGLIDMMGWCAFHWWAFQRPGLWSPLLINTSPCSYPGDTWDQFEIPCLFSPGVKLLAQGHWLTPDSAEDVAEGNTKRYLFKVVTFSSCIRRCCG